MQHHLGAVRFRLCKSERSFNRNGRRRCRRQLWGCAGVWQAPSLAAAPHMDVRVLFFARSRELAGTNEATLSMQPGSTTTALMPLLLQQASRRAKAGIKALPIHCFAALQGCCPGLSSPVSPNCAPSAPPRSPRPVARPIARPPTLPLPAVPSAGRAGQHLRAQPQPGVPGTRGGAAAEGRGRGGSHPAHQRRVRAAGSPSVLRFPAPPKPHSPYVILPMARQRHTLHLGPQALHAPGMLHAITMWHRLVSGAPEETVRALG